MATTTARKLRISAGDTLLTVNAPPDFKKNLGLLPEKVKVTDKAKTFDQVHWFVKDKAIMVKGFKKVLPLVKGAVICWIYFPKGRSGIQTDLNRDNGWELLMKEDLQWLSLVSFDPTWSVFGVREKNESDRKKESNPKTRPILEYIDPVKKVIRLPADLSDFLGKYPKEAAFYNALSFTNKKEYVEWVVSAKREETRTTRIRECIERLAKGWNNPANR
jgi:hypothetical protein